MNSSELRQYRLAQQGIIRSDKKTPLQVIENLGAAQGQDYRGSLWAIGLRTGLTQAEIITAIENQEIIRTWPQRGTLHFVPPLDAQWMVGLSADRLIKGAARRRALLELNNAHFQKAEKVVVAALTGGKVVSRPKLIELLAQEGISTTDGRAYHIIWDLAQRGIIFISAMSGNQPTYGLVKDTFPESAVLSREDAVTLLTKRYFMSHGPATLQDFAWWTGLTMKDVRFGLSQNETLLRKEIVDGQEYWLDKNASLPANKTQTAYLLPGFDEYFLGYKDRGMIIDPSHIRQIVPGNNGMFKPMVAIDGRIVGTWKRLVKKGRVVITLCPFEKLLAEDLKSIATPAKQYGHFLGLPVELEVV